MVSPRVRRLHHDTTSLSWVYSMSISGGWPLFKVPGPGQHYDLWPPWHVGVATTDCSSLRPLPCLPRWQPQCGTKELFLLVIYYYTNNLLFLLVIYYYTNHLLFLLVIHYYTNHRLFVLVIYYVTNHMLFLLVIYYYTNNLLFLLVIYYYTNHLLSLLVIYYYTNNLLSLITIHLLLH